MFFNYKFLEIPLVARWEFNGNKLKPFIEFGISPTFYLNTKVIQETDIDRKKIDTANNAEGIALFHLVGLVSCGVNYVLTENIQLFGQPIFRSHLSPLVHNVRVKEYLYNTGLEIGIRKGLN